MSYFGNSTFVVGMSHFGGQIETENTAYVENEHHREERAQPQLSFPYGFILWIQMSQEKQKSAFGRTLVKSVKLIVAAVSFWLQILSAENCQFLCFEKPRL